MRFLITSIVLSCFCVPAVAQSVTSDQALLTRTRSLYDAPFTRGLISFDCALNFDWKQHFVDLFGTTPPAAISAVERLQAIQHRVFVDRSGAIVSAIPKAPDLGSVAHAAELEQVFIAITASGLNAWLPSSTNVLLPVGPTKSVQENRRGIQAVNGPGVAAQLLLTADMRLMWSDSSSPSRCDSRQNSRRDPTAFFLRR